ncbi:MAG: metallopeptidase TldD-related protein [Cyclobacteriaceae bacterium]
MKNILSLIFLLSIITGQLYAQFEKDSIIVKAMQDELARNIEQLSYKDYEKPFFIAYSIGDIEFLYANASLGALINSNENRMREVYGRLMVGSYELNDENFVDESNGRQNQFATSSPLPIENDYLGIRRSLWTISNNMYKSAASTYKNKIKAMEQHNIERAQLELDDYSRTPKVNIRIENPAFQMNPEETKALARDLSAEFNKYPYLEMSAVSIFLYNTRMYHVDSEGSVAITPVTMAVISVLAQTISDDGEMLGDRLMYYANTPAEWPSAEVINQDIEKLAAHVKDLKKAEQFVGNYNGPLLIEKQEAATFLYNNFFKGSSALKASRRPLKLNSLSNSYVGIDYSSIEAMVDKKIVDKDLNVITYSSLKKYKDYNLLGHFHVDAEGVKPVDSLQLVENGILKNLLNNRTPTHLFNTSNGYLRYGVGAGSFTRGLAPGVVQIQSPQAEDLSIIKQKLHKLAAEEGMSIAIVAKPLEGLHASVKPVNFYKINLKDSSEVLLRSVMNVDFPENPLRKIIAVSDEEVVFNMMDGGNYGQGNTGFPVGIIAPDAVLIEEFKMQGMPRTLTTGNLPVVSHPNK